MRTPKARSLVILRTGLIEVAHQRALGDLESQPSRVEAGVGQVPVTMCMKSGLANSTAETLTEMRTGTWPVSCHSTFCRQASPSTPGSDRDDHPRLLGDRDEFGRTMRPNLGWFHSRRASKPRQAAFQVHLGLVSQSEFVPSQGAA
jgi:hypothetical protein